MFSPGERVVYAQNGVCEILGTEEKKFGKACKTYLVLAPVAQPDTRFYLCAENPAAMEKLHTLMTAREAHALLTDQPAVTDWIQDEGLRKQRYRELLSDGSRQELMGMLRAVCRHRRMQLTNGRKFHICDESFLHDGKRLLCAELSAALEITEKQTDDLLRAALES